jgi:hypothetical protein
MNVESLLLAPAIGTLPIITKEHFENFYLELQYPVPIEPIPPE